MIKNILYIAGSILVFFTGMILYGIILNLREESLTEAMISKGLRYLVNVSLQVDRKNYKLDLYSDSILVKSYRVVFGKNSSSNKKLIYDYATPVGKYHICSVDTSGEFYRFFRIDYPNKKDAEEALTQKLITRTEYEKIISEIDAGICPTLKDQKLVIGIHGIGRLNPIFKNLPFVFNWTNGSIALSNEDMDELFEAIKIGTEVVIKN